MEKSQMTILFFTLAGLGVGVLITTVLTRYSGLISMGAELGSGKGYIVIDGRSINHPTLPLAEQPTASSPAPGDRALGK